MTDWTDREPSAPMRPIWVATMVDLLAILVSFFVLMFATSQIRAEPWRALTAGFQARLDQNAGERPTTPDEPLAPRTMAPRAVDLDYLHRLLSDKAARHPLLRRAALQRRDDAVVLAIPGDLLFPPDGAMLSPEAAAAAAELAGALRFVANRIEIVGHSDPTPPSARGPYPSNWELSLARSLSFAHALLASGYQLDVGAVGYADARFDPAAEMTQARRVELVIRAAKGDVRVR